MRYVLSTMGIITFIATIMSGVLWAAGFSTAVAVIITVTAMLWLALIVVATIAITAWWTRRTMEAGADIALRAQDVNDRWDAAKTRDLAALVREGAKIGRMVTAGQSSGDLPMLMPGQDDTWLPDLVEFETPMVEIEQPDEH